MKILQNFQWNLVSILAERRTDLIWRLTKDGLEYAAEVKNIRLAKSILFHETDDLESIMLATAEKSRSKLIVKKRNI